MKTLMLVFLLAGAALFAEDAAVSYRAKADFSLTADPAAAHWAAVPAVEFEHGRYGEAIPGYRTQVRSRWTSKNLYFLFTCPYEALFTKPGEPGQGETNELWKWDAAEIFIGSDFENIRRYKEFEVSPRGEWIDLSVELAAGGGKHNIDWLWNSGFENKTRIDEQRKVWYCEMRIPVAAIAPWVAAEGREFRANFYRIQGKPPKFLAWRPVNQNWFHRPEAFGKLVLGGAR